MQAVRCPVCNGNGLVPEGFYRQTSGCWGSTSTTPETCQSCKGTGFVVVPDEPHTLEGIDSQVEIKISEST